MIAPRCPVCGKPLTCEKPAWHCEAGHSFDVARQGYVNLLTVDRKHSLHPGDTRDMVAARRAFLDAGHYTPIAKTLSALIAAYAPEASSVLDAGCGEGYYLAQLPHIPHRWGIDISKEAVRFAAVREKSAHWLTATAAALPFDDGSFDVLLSMFALTVESEFFRVLKPGGIFIQVLAGPHHLPELKSIIYPEILEKEKHLHPEFAGFTRLESRTLTFSFQLQGQAEVQNLLLMTPHVWRISKAGAQALSESEGFVDTAEVIFNIYCRQPDKSLLE